MAFITRVTVLAVTALTLTLTFPARSLAEPDGHEESSDEAGHDDEHNEGEIGRAHV